MNKRNLVIFAAIWLLLLSLAPITVISNSNMDRVWVNKVLTVNFFQRILGLAAYTLLFVQVVLGSNMNFWRKHLGGNALKIHISNGLLTYTVVLLHPLAWVVITYFARSRFDPYFPFIDICLLCKSTQEWMINFGRLAFWSVTIAVTAGLLRGYNRFMVSHWRKFHHFNYLAFIFVFVHSIGMGSDVGTIPFSLFHGPAAVIVGLLILRRIIKASVSLVRSNKGLD